MKSFNSSKKMNSTLELKWTPDEPTRAWLDAWLVEGHLTVEELARCLGFTGTRVSKYRHTDRAKTPEPDMPAVESAVKNFRRQLERRARTRELLFENKVSDAAFAVFKQISRTGDVGLIHGPAGVGKTSAAELYCVAHPDSMLLTATRYRRDAGSVVRMLWAEVEAGSDSLRWDKRLPRAQWLEAVLRGSARLLLVDNAHKLHFTGLEFLFDFQDATGLPICLIGNPEVLDTLRRSDQLFSRVGIMREIKLADDVEDCARAIVRQEIPDAVEELAPRAASDLGRMGHSRRLRKQLVLCRTLREGARNKDWLANYEAAGKALVSASRN